MKNKKNFIIFILLQLKYLRILPLIDFNGKKVLTVGGSGDHLINAYLLAQNMLHALIKTQFKILFRIKSGSIE
jgi:hypothetical protein